jgi:TolB protein
LWLVNADGTDEHKIVGQGFEPDWSPDGTKLAYASGRKVVIANADGSDARVITGGSDPAWSPDGQELAVADKGGIWIVSADGQNRRRVIAKGSQPDWSPDGKQLVFTGPDPNYELMVANADGSDPRSLHVPQVDSPTWSPDGTEIAFTGCTLCGSGGDVVNVWEIRPNGSGKQTLRTGGDGFNWAYDPSWGPKPGQLVYVYSPSVNSPGDGLGHLVMWPGKQRLTRDPPPVVRISSATGRTTAPIDAGGPVQALAVSRRVAAALVNEPSGGWAVEIYQPRPRIIPLPTRPHAFFSAAGTTLVFQIGHTIETLDALQGPPQAVATIRGNTAIGLSIFGRRITWADRGRIRILDLPR